MIPLDPDAPTRAAYQFAKVNGVVYNLELTADLEKLIAAQGWSLDSATPVTGAAFGDLLFTNAFAGLPCFALGGGVFRCHEAPLGLWFYFPDGGLRWQGGGGAG